MSLSRVTCPHPRFELVDDGSSPVLWGVAGRFLAMPSPPLHRPHHGDATDESSSLSSSESDYDGGYLSVR